MAMMRTYGLYVNGQYIQSGATRAVHSPQNPAVDVGQLAWMDSAGPAQAASDEILEAVLQGATETFEQIQAGFFPLAERLAFLERLKARLNNEAERIALTITLEVGKPIAMSRIEVNRALSTLEWTGIEATRVFTPLGLPMQSRPHWKGLEGWSVLEPRGPLLAITPFNFPLNLVMHKLAPAIASGCPVILKPSPKAALVALALADLCHAEQLPAGMLSVLHCDDVYAGRLLRDSRVAHASFTGSAKVGWKLREGITKPLALELGGTGPGYVDETADLAVAAKKIVAAGLGYAGQVCISLQNVKVHRKVWNEFSALLKKEVASLAWGNPDLDSVTAGPVIDGDAAKRLQSWREKVLADGGQVLAEAGAPSEAAPTTSYVKPTIFTGVNPESSTVYEEVFGPFFHCDPIDSFDAWIKEANALPARFQACVFTGSLSHAHRAANELRYGAVLVNEPSALRVETMPFGGRGVSGDGREGPAFAMESFCERKAIVMRP